MRPMSTSTRHDHVSDEQPLIHLFTVPLDVVKARCVTGGKFKGAPRKPKGSTR